MGTKKLSIFYVIFAFIVLVGGQAVAETAAEPPANTQTQPAIVINEIQTNGVGTGKTGEEFIELTNITGETVAIDSWKLHFITSTGNLSTAKTFLTFPTGFSISPGSSVLVCPLSYTACTGPSATYITNTSFTGLSAPGGSVLLVNSNDEWVDLVGWGTNSATKCEFSLASAPPDGQSIQRKTVGGVPLDSNNNGSDFTISIAPSPTNNNQIIAVPPVDEPEPTPTPTPSPEPSDGPEPEPTPTPTPTPTLALDNQPNPPENLLNSKYQPILINELYIDPVSPETDSKDEWVELYNPNDTAQDLQGYTIYAGETFAYHHTFTATTIIQPHGYIVVSSGDTSIALANSGGAVKLTDPNNETLDQTSYETAKAGMAWAKNESGIWQWTTTPTVASQNIVTVALDPVVVVAAAAKKVAKATASTTKATATPKPTATKKASATPTKTTKVKAASTTATEPAVVDAPSPLPLWLLAVLGTLAVLYSLYEYRFEIANKIYQFKQYRIHRKTNR